MVQRRATKVGPCIIYLGTGERHRIQSTHLSIRPLGYPQEPDMMDPGSWFQLLASLMYFSSQGGKRCGMLQNVSVLHFSLATSLHNVTLQCTSLRNQRRICHFFNDPYEMTKSLTRSIYCCPLGSSPWSPPKSPTSSPQVLDM